mgnify:CR=1 FL=1
MDRFIDLPKDGAQERLTHLKSNMDRFIGRTPRTVAFINTDLKSNMDRFIAQHFKITSSIDKVFKIQYG